MARLNVYVPDELAARSKAAGLNVSALTQRAMTAALEAAATDTWLESLSRGKESTVSTEDLMSALDEARGELGDVV
jgi:post-segregation antitoxin (ccd killing protein)